MGYLYLTIAILAEIIAKSALKASEEFTKVIPTIIVIIGYGISFYFLSLVLKLIPIGIAYAIWSGVGIIGIGLIGLFFFKQVPDLPAIIGMLLIILGVIVINVFSKTVSH